jgi:hypothetical protein
MLLKLRQHRIHCISATKSDRSYRAGTWIDAPPRHQQLLRFDDGKNSASTELIG